MNSQNVALMPQRPPYVEFERRAEEDRAATIEKGYHVAKDVDYAIIRAIGAKDSVDKEAQPWLDHLAVLAQRGDYPKPWVDFFKDQYAKWKAGHELEVNGIHVKSWPGISPAQRDNLIAARILTVQDVAAANEETLTRIGMGARQLQQRAQAYLDAIAQGGASEELAMLRDKTKNQDDKIAALESQLATVIAKLEEVTGESSKPSTMPRARARG